MRAGHCTYRSMLVTRTLLMSTPVVAAMASRMSSSDKSEPARTVVRRMLLMDAPRGWDNRRVAWKVGGGL